ncbi:MAG: DUF4251 domain-containing protein [Alistipes sp.]|nr:DUF4251 domain-containing protein [Alistipes sp.]
MKKLWLFSLLCLFCTSSIFAQTSDDILVEQAVNQLLGKKTFTFVANRIITSGSNQSMLNQMNTMSVNKDTLTVKLPYSGKGFSSSDLGSSNPLQFTSTEFTYKVEVTKKGEKVITMDVKSPNGTDRFTFTLTVNKGVLARLLITGTSRSNMDFSGYITELGQDKANASK